MNKQCPSCGNINVEAAAYCSKCGAALPAAATYTAVATAQYAGFWMRTAALFLDVLVLGLLGAALFFEPFSNMAIAWLYYALMESSKYQGTVGKIALSIKVTTVNGQQLSFGRATARHFCKYISGVLLCIGFLMAAFTEKKQALHDLITECVVVRSR